MDKRLFVFVVGMAMVVVSYGQVNTTSEDAIAAAQDAADAVAVVLEANNLLYSVTQVYSKSTQAQKLYDNIQAMLADPKASKFISVSQNQEFVIELQMFSMKINMYGQALEFMLKAITRNMEKHAMAVAEKNMAAIMAAEVGSEEEETNMTDALMGTTNARPTQQHIALSSSNSEFRQHMQQALDYIEGLMPKVLKINKDLDELNGNLSRMFMALNSGVGGQAMFLMSIAPGMVPSK